METLDLTNPWDENGSLASDWSASDAEVLDTPAVGNVQVAEEQPEEQAGKEVRCVLTEPHCLKQVGIKCWAFALASWISAQQAWDDAKNLGIVNGQGMYPNPDEVFKKHRSCTDPNGGLIYDRWPDVAKGELMNWVTANGTKITPQYIASNIRNKGYLYWVNQPSNATFSHACVIYGIVYNTKGSPADCVLIMDPQQGILTTKYCSDIASIQRNLIAWRGVGIQETSP